MDSQRVIKPTRPAPINETRHPGRAGVADGGRVQNHTEPGSMGGRHLGDHASLIRAPAYQAEIHKEFI